MTQAEPDRVEVSIEDGSKPSQKSSLSTGSAKFIMATTVILCGAALWNSRAFGVGEAGWLLAFLIAMTIRAPHSKRNAANAIIVSFADPREIVTLPLLLTVLVLPLVHLAGWLPASLDHRLPIGLTWLGLALQVPYLWLFYRSHADLTRNWSPSLEIRHGHELVTAGIYRHIRHPMYAAVAISAVAQPLLLQNWLAGLPAVFVTILFLAVRMPAEERMMESHFGASYLAYRELTGHLFPRLRKGRLS